MSHTRAYVESDRFWIFTPSGDSVLYCGAKEAYGWSVYQYNTSRVASMLPTKELALRTALACLSRDMLLDGTLPAISPEDRVYFPNSGELRYHMEK